MEKMGQRGLPHLTAPGEEHGHHEVSYAICSVPRLGKIPVSQKHLIREGISGLGVVEWR